MSQHHSPARRPIVKRQNDDDLQQLLRAALATYATAGRIATFRTSVSLGVAAAALLATFVPASGNAIALVGALWTVALEIGPTRWLDVSLDRAATLLEMFDVDLYGLPWNEIQAGKRMEWHEVRRAARRFRDDGHSTLDYYEIPSLPQAVEVLACQMQNLAWGSRVRLRFVHAVIATMVIWIVAGIGIGFVEQLTVAQLMIWWYIPSLAAFLIGLDVIRGQSSVIKRRHRALEIVTDAISDGRNTHELEILARQTQDVIFLTRQQVERVPAQIFRGFQKVDHEDFRVASAALTKWTSRHSSP